MITATVTAEKIDWHFWRIIVQCLIGLVGAYSFMAGILQPNTPISFYLVYIVMIGCALEGIAEAVSEGQKENRFRSIIIFFSFIGIIWGLFLGFWIGFYLFVIFGSDGNWLVSLLGFGIMVGCFYGLTMPEKVGVK